MDVITAIAGKMAELTVIPIGRQVGYVLFYKENFKELEDKKEELMERKVRIEHGVETEKMNGRDIEDDVLSWQKRVDETLEQARKLCEAQTHASVWCWKWSFPNLISRHQLGRKAKKMSFTIIELKEKGRFDGGLGHVPVSGISKVFSNQGSEKLKSRNSVKEEVLLALTDPKVSKVGIYGWGGVGKTTLAKEVAKHANDDKRFDLVVMATISQTMDVERVQDDIAYQLGFHLDEKTPIGRADRLCRRIKKEKNILIILDDVWEKIDLDKIGIPTEQDLKGGKLSLTSKHLEISQKNETCQGCKLFLTSRRLDILQKNEIHRIFALEALNNAESWALFEDMVGDAIKDVDLQTIATQVVERCAGLPVMIVSIAKSLKYNKNIHYWKDTLNNLKRVDSGDMYGNVFVNFEFTYNRLEDDEMKKVFLLCGVKGPSMSVSDLLKYAIGLSVFKYVDTVEDARNRLYKIIDGLKASCLLLEDEVSKTGKIKMHDLVCEVAVSLAYKNEHVFVLKENDRMQDWSSNGFLERCTQIIIKTCTIQLPQKLDCPNLKFFFLHLTDNCTLEIPDSFFEVTGSLKALDLTGFVISSLPKSLICLTKLKTLCLDQCILKHMDGIGSLINLEILSFIYSSMTEIPREIEQLTRLRMLDLRKSKIGIISPNILSKLTKIEELYMSNASIKWEGESSIKQNKSASLAMLGCLTSLTILEIQIREAGMLPRDLMFDKLERYKVLIGDKWEWSAGNKMNLRLLKLKLHTSIHLLHGIKALIKRVEDLSLDEVNGISDVLFQLDAEGFPLLKHLHIQNNGQLQHIINTMERNTETRVLFPELETLSLHNLNNLVKICHGPLYDNSFRKLTVIKVKSCDQLVYLFHVSILNALSQLVEIEVSKCRSIKRIVLIENDDSGMTSDYKIEFHSLRSLSLYHLPAIQDFCSNEFTSCMTATSLFNGIKVSFSSLETLKLSSINLEKIWNDDELCAANCIHNLANLIVEDCRGLKHLFSSSVIGSLLKLKHLEISKCELMEEIITPMVINSTTLEQVRFSQLETMVIKDMESLKKAWHFQFKGLKTLEVSNCGNLANIFPSDMQGTYGNLETLNVCDCSSLEEIFESTAKEIHIDDQISTQVSQLKNLLLLGLPKLKQIWGRDAQAKLHRFHNLQVVWVKDCNNLEYLFPFFIAMYAIQLEHITIENARSMRQLVSDKEGILDRPVKFEFNHLISLVLWSLNELEGFFAGNHSLFCPLLRKLDIRTCGKLKLFKTRYWNSQGGVFDSKSQVSMHQPLFKLEEATRNLEELALNSENLNMILQGQFSMENFNKLKVLCLTRFEDDQSTFPYSFLQKITSLEHLVVEWSFFKEIFQEEIAIDEKRRFEIRTRIKMLILYQLHKLQHICKEGFPIDPVLETLEVLWVQHCSNLKHLVHSSVTFSHLTYLEVENCNGLIHLITSSTARSLVKLTDMKIKNCDSLEQVVAEEREGSKDEIAFNILEVLELECLPKIKRFCSSNCVLNLPSLVGVVVKQCPRMSIFSVKDASTPMLQEILSKEEDEKIYWEGDLNRTINQMFVDMVAFHSFKHLELAAYPELRELWYNHVQPEVFGNLYSLVVHKCDFLSDVLLPLHLVQALSNLEKLQVSECDSLEAVFDLTNMDQEEVFVNKTIQVKGITLSRLPKLKHIWKPNLQELVNFRETTEGHLQHHRPACSIQRVFCSNLQVVWVEDCENLEYLFPFDIVMHAIQLEHIGIKNARSMKQIVSDKEGLMDSPVKFEFNRLISLELWFLDEVEGFFAGNHSLLCPLLRELDVRECAKLKLFKSHWSSQGGVFDSKSQVSMQQPLFTLEEVICNLERLALDSENSNLILQGKFSMENFSKLKFLCLRKFEDDQTSFPYWFLQNITSLEHIVVEWSSFKEIFQEEMPKDEGKKFEIRTGLKGLILNQLHKLQHISKEGFQIDPILEDLESLEVVQCSNLKHLVPSSVTFSHLTYLEVENCNGLIHLITSSTARSLVKLTTMKISNCISLEKVVIEEKEGSDEDEIIFSNLEILELECLPKIKRFCSSNCSLNLPLLEEVVVNKCPRMDSFSGKDTSTPKLQKISSKEDGKVYWEGDINKTIKKLFADMVMFSSFNRLEFSEYPELKEIWYSQVGQKIFCNLKHLVVRKCTFLSNTLFSSILLQLLYTLEELEVAGCDSLEAVFDVKALNDTTMESKGVSGLKKLTLSGLPNLKHIWNTEAGEIISFGNLQIVKVDECPNLKYVFSSSLCQDLRQLEELNIESCGVEKIFANEEGLEELKFHFPLLRILLLINLRQLNDFYPKRYTLGCPSLKILNVRQCEALQIFAFEHLDSYQLKGGCGDLSIQQALFHIEKVPENLEEISLTERDAMRILNRNYEKKLFQRTDTLRLQYFQETPMKILNDLVQKFPATTTLHARCSYFKTLFPSADIGHCSIQSAPQIKTLGLFLLEKLEHIWNDNSALDTLVPNLEHLSVYECCSLIRLAPPLTSFTNLITLVVDDCNGMMDFMSPFTAKSLVHLTSLKITNCKMLEEVVTTNEGGPEEEIIFKSLKYLELTCLPCFKSFCFGKHTFIFPSLVTLEVTGCHKMQNFSYGITVAPFLKLVKVEHGKKRWKGDLNTTINHLFLEKTNENLNMDATEASSSKEQVGESMPNQIAGIGKQDTKKNEASSGTERPLAQVAQNAYSPSANQETELIGLARGTQEMDENIEKPYVEAAKFTRVYEGVIRIQETHKSIDQMPLVQPPQKQIESHHNLEKANETIEKPLIQIGQEAQRPAAIQDIEGSNESKACRGENFFNQPKIFVTNDKIETSGTQEIHDTIDKPLIQTDQDVEKLATTQNAEESRDLHIEAQKICNTINRPSIPTTQNVPNSSMIREAAIDPSPSQAPEPIDSSMQKLNIYKNYKEMINIPEQNMPYLETGVNRHPQVLDWLNTTRRRVFTSSFFSLFADVTRILRTTRKVDLTEDDRNYIRECCTVLEGVGFDESWINYVHGCIEECGDGEDLKRKVEEAEGQASNLKDQIESMKKELASVEESLVLLRGKASKLHDFIES